MTRASDTAKLLGAGATILDGTTISTDDNTDQLILKSTDADAAVGPVLRLNRDSGSPADNDLIGSIIFQADDDGGNTTNLVEFITQIEDASNGSESADLHIKTRTAGSLVSRIGMYNSTTVINEDSADIDFRVESDNLASALHVNGADGTFSINGTTTGGDMAKINNSTSAWLLNLNNASASDQIIISSQSGTGTVTHHQLNNSNGLVGKITTNGSTTTYATSSDYRIKENISYNFDATTRLKQLKPARFNFIPDETNTLVDGFIAHEVSSIVPEAVIGEKDATETYTDDDGNEQTRISPQAIDQSKLVPLLVKTVQEQQAVIESLTTRITTLENA